MPAFNAARHLDVTLAYYAEIGARVSVFVDTKSTDDTLSVAQRAGCDVQEIDNPSTRVGAILETMSRRLGTRWVLRIDDDELPSRRLIDYAISIAEGTSIAESIAFHRCECTINSAGEILYHRTHTSGAHRQIRLYRPEGLAFSGTGHTAGFEEHNLMQQAAPRDALMIHLDWVVHSPAERASKMARYDAHTPGHGSMWRHFYLADQSLDFAAQLAALPCDDFRTAGRQLAAQFPAAAARATATAQDEPVRETNEATPRAMIAMSANLPHS